MENQEKEKGGDRMNEEISQMMPFGIQAIKLAVELSGESCQWGPPKNLGVSKCPGYPLKTKPVGYGGLIVDILRIV
jgi:hypothetical protein